MLNVDEALAIVLNSCHPLAPQHVALEDALHHVLAETIVADGDSPPFDKALMDGYAVLSADCDGQQPRSFRIAEEILAGQTSTRPLTIGEAASIMTGAPLPPGADAVIPHERTRAIDPDHVEIAVHVKPGASVLRKGREMTRGQILFEPGVRLDPLKLGVLATVGTAKVAVIPSPRIMILPTGDELVGIGETPGPGQIRETNSTILKGMSQTWGIASTRPPASDTPETLRFAMLEAFSSQTDVVILSGGVSAGKKDLVPATLEALGVRILFHHVRLKPGKPLLFGVRDREGGLPPSLVFGLPGNPVSSAVGFMLFVAPALRKLRGEPATVGGSARFPLGSTFTHHGDRPTYHPSRKEAATTDAPPRVTPMTWSGSADLYTVAQADGFIRFPEGDRIYHAGDLVDYFPFSTLMPDV